MVRIFRAGSRHEAGFPSSSPGHLSRDILFLRVSNSSASFCCLFCFRETLLLSCLFLFLRCPWGTEAMTAVWTLLPPAKNKKRAFFVLLFLFIILWSVSSCIRSACWLLHRSFLGVDDVPCFRFSCVWVCSFFFAGKANKFWNRNPEQDFRHLLVIFLPGTFNKYPLLSQRSIFGLFERNLVVLADFAHSKFLTDGYSPSFDFITRF